MDAMLTLPPKLRRALAVVEGREDVHLVWTAPGGAGVRGECRCGWEGSIRPWLGNPEVATIKAIEDTMVHAPDANFLLTDTTRMMGGR